MNIPFDDVQGTILRGYRVERARHFVLRIDDKAGAGELILKLVDGQLGLPPITTAQRGQQKPIHFLNISFTRVGLSQLGLSDAQLQTFDASFYKGATNPDVAAEVGDCDDSAPQNWIGSLNDGCQVHALLSLWVDGGEAPLESASAALRRAFAEYGVTELSAQDAVALPDNRVHFGYRDSIAQPTIDGAPPRKRSIPDDQPSVATGEFLLGYLNESDGYYSLQPEELSLNSSFAAFRILEQDVAGFESFLQTYAGQLGMDAEMLAAKVCGRWRNGNPLTLMPNDEGSTLPPDQLNAFHYVSNDAKQDDTLGLKCPIGSHIRRSNPRDGAVVGAGSPSHRIVRRAMPYGPAYDPAQPDQQKRGLIGYFINASLSNQFEFLTSQWALDYHFVKSATGPGGSEQGNAVFNISGEDVFLGVNHVDQSSFTDAHPGRKGQNNKHITGFPRLIHTRGGAYCFFPSISGLRYLAQLASG
ncbi:Dye-decolorizing peroxidase [Chromobacterium vaccinii]|nr:Dye-decolorizing peroxidase [Chromobacterium vaccinii]QND90900.1 Dye-decolorizing peroxidase [Chromobacterium vaccinii]